MKMITCVEYPGSDENAVRIFTPSGSHGSDGHSLVHVANQSLIVNPGKYY